MNFAWSDDYFAASHCDFVCGTNKDDRLCEYETVEGRNAQTGQVTRDEVAQRLQQIMYILSNPSLFS
jgi:hypothetical protein